MHWLYETGCVSLAVFVVSDMVVTMAEARCRLQRRVPRGLIRSLQHGPALCWTCRSAWMRGRSRCRCRCRCGPAALETGRLQLASLFRLTVTCTCHCLCLCLCIGASGASAAWLRVGLEDKRGIRGVTCGTVGCFRWGLSRSCIVRSLALKRAHLGATEAWPGNASGHV